MLENLTNQINGARWIPSTKKLKGRETVKAKKNVLLVQHILSSYKTLIFSYVKIMLMNSGLVGNYFNCI